MNKADKATMLIYLILYISAKLLTAKQAYQLTKYYGII